jgi:transposase
MAIEITRDEMGAAELRRAACRSVDADQARRLLAIASVLEGRSREDAARAAGMQRQTLRDWVLRYNTDGIAGLVDRPRSGRPARLKPEQLAALETIATTPPDVATDGVVRWRRADLRQVIKKRFGVDLSERSVGRLLNECGLRRLSVRPQHPQSDEAAQEAFKKTSPRA